MRNLNKVVGCSVIALLTFTVTSSGLAATAFFTDISGIGSKDKIIALQEQGYVKGIGNGLFAPSKKVTAAEGVQFIVKALDMNIDTIRFIKKPEATDFFPKANNNAWYANTLIIAAMNNVELPKDFDPNKELTREEFINYLTQAMESQGKLPMIKIIPPHISDQDNIDSNYIGTIQRAIIYRITLLDAQGNFNPKENVTRADAAEQIYNAASYLKAHSAPTASTN